MSMEFQKLLSQDSLVAQTIPKPEEIIANIKERNNRGKLIQTMYGETYDRLGSPLDSIKYYFYIAAIKWTLQRENIEVEPTILIADVAACHNEPEDEHPELMRLGKERVGFVRAVDATYNLGLNVLIMSEYLNSKNFKSRLRCVYEQANNRPDIYKWIRQTVPPKKVDIEKEKDFAYAFEEVATIIGYDLKVGPPREKFYDEPARLIGQALGLTPLQSVYLRPTFPLGLSRSFFFTNEEVEQYGVTPYKAGSKGLQEHRIVIGKTSVEDVAFLVDRSIISKKPNIPNAVLDLVIIAEMAKQWLEGELKPITVREHFYNGKILPDELKDMAIANLNQYLLRPLTSNI